MKNKIEITDSFQAWAHKWGRVGTLIALLYMIAIPFVVLTFITGNIMNLKLSCAVNAMKLAKKEPNTPEGKVISSVAVAVCSIMTIIILAIAALLSSWISPLFELPAVKTASNYLIPALFGSLTLGLFASTNSGKKSLKTVLWVLFPS